ncbi:MAG TPA: T9SS type A sorting domain-containing protein [Niastella sp.]
MLNITDMLTDLFHILYIGRMKRPLICLLLAGATLPLFSQDKILLEDDFNNNKNKWKLQKDRDFVVDIRSGVFYMEKLDKNFDRRGCLWYNKPIPKLNTLNNFSVTMYAKLVSGGDIFEMFDLQWGVRDNTKKEKKDHVYQLSLILKGDVKLDYFNDKWNYFIRKNVRTTLQENGFRPGNINKYELLQKDGFIIFLVNDKELLRQLTNPIPGNSIGFQQCMKSAWEIDKIIVRQLQTGKNNTKDTASTIPLMSSDTPTSNGLKVYPNPFTNSFNINFELDKDETVQINLIDMNGAVLQQHSRKLLKGQQNIRLYADVAPGSYVVKVQVGNMQAKTTTVIKL